LQKRGSLAAATPRNPDCARELGPFRRKSIEQHGNNLIAIAVIGALLRQSSFAVRRLAAICRVLIRKNRIRAAYT
jgi:hypothetical protein